MKLVGLLLKVPRRSLFRRIQNNNNNNNRTLLCIPYSSSSSTPGTGTTGPNDQVPKEDGQSDGLPKAYDPVLFESSWIEKWLMRRRKKDGGPPFRMILPPPNVTGKLHLGHALTIAIQDTIVRWKNMQGYRVEWIPGFDHAGIATHSVAMRKFQKDYDFGREITGEKAEAEFEARIRETAELNLKNIQQQLHSLGPLLDWDSLYYTLDEGHSNVVKEAFVALFEAGLIQRGDGIVNWSCSLKSSISDVEVDHVDFKGRMTMRVPQHKDLIEFGVLYNCKYNLENSDEFLTVATSRPETMFGDVAVAVNTADSRYSRFIGKQVINPVNGNLIPVIGDDRVKTDFGTGAVKITPAHDKLDFAIAVSNNLTKVDILTDDGFLNELTGPYKGKPRFEARNEVIRELDGKGALEDAKEYSGVINLCSRTGDVIEPKVLPHWFLRTQKLTDTFTGAIRSGSFLIAPENYAADILHTLSNCQDWCLSRQIKWGHKIPAYYHVNYPSVWVCATDINSAKKQLEQKHNLSIKTDNEVVQDKDVLDTWFSSSLIPLALSGWPDIKDVNEISLMETGFDILLFWVWRMVITTLALCEQFPFKHVLLHGIVSDKYGRKMSKSKGNVIDPLHVINGISYADLVEEAKKSFECGELEKNEYDLRIGSIDSDYAQGFKAYGRDALRFALLSQNIKSQQVSLDIVYLESCRNFTNKLWQALRFFFLHRNNRGPLKPVDQPTILSINSIADQWLLACLYDFAAEVEKDLDAGNFHLYAESIKKFFYQQLCDVYIELVKTDFKSGEDSEQHLLVMEYAIKTGIKLSHPLIPFVTEEMWSRLHADIGLLVDQDFPTSKDLESFRNPELNEKVMKTIRLVKEIRSFKSRIGIKSSVKSVMFVEPSASDISKMKMMKSHIDHLAGCQLYLGAPPEMDRSKYITLISQIDGKIWKLSTTKSEGSAKYLETEKNKIAKLQVKLAKLKQQYENPNFQQYAAADVKEKLKKRLETLEIQINEVMSASPDSGNKKNP